VTFVHAEQAATLRALSQAAVDVKSPSRKAAPRVIAVASGKGGVGKTSLTASLAVIFAQAGARVLAVDGDLGLANLDLALGATPEYSLADLVEGRARVDQVLAPTAAGVQLLAAARGRFDLANLSDRDRHNLFALIDTLEESFDMLLIDVAAGIGANAVAFAGAAQHTVIVANPEPTALADAYAFIKVLATQYRVREVHLVANMVRSAAEGEAVYRRLATMLERFLGIGLGYLGAVVRDPAVPRAVMAGQPLVLTAPKSAASHCMAAIADKLSQLEAQEASPGGIRLFWKRFIAMGATA
jgi:flagellar biosynthesis protein FlhG